MADLFLHYGRMGLMAAPVLAVLLALLPRLRRRYRAQGRCVLWLLLTLWLLCPVLPELPQAPVQVPLPAVLVQPTADAADPAAADPTAAAPDPAGQGAAPAMTLTPLTVLTAVWAAGGAALLAWELGRYARFRHRVRRTAVPLAGEPGVYVSPAVPSPVSLGLLRPMIVLPTAELDPAVREDILRHERAHLRRGDLWTKRLLLLARAVHWYDPLVHWMARAAAGDMELASDDLALRGADRAARRRYAETVYAGLAASQHRDALTTSFQGGKDIMERRFTEILGFGPQKKGRAVVALAVACVLALTGLVGCSQYVTPALIGENDPEVGEPAAVPVDPSSIGTRQGRTAMLTRAVELADAYFLAMDSDGNDVVLRYEDPYPLNAQTVWVLEERDGRYLVAQPTLDAPCYVNGWVERDAVSFDPALIAQGEFVELTDATLYEDRGETVAEEHVDGLASIEARDGDWTKVYLPGGQEGWVATDALSWDIDQQVRCLEE